MKNIIFILLFSFSFNALSAETVVMETSKGTIEIELYDEKAPITVKNFLDYVDINYFDGTLFYRTIKNFVIQGGGLLPDMTEKPQNGAIKNEAMNGLSNLRGTIGMAREDGIDTATSHYFINTVDNVRLDYRGETPRLYGYAVFGKVTLGMDVVDAIQNVPTHTVGTFEDTPVEQVLVISVRRK